MPQAEPIPTAKNQACAKGGQDCILDQLSANNHFARPAPAIELDCAKGPSVRVINRHRAQEHDHGERTHQVVLAEIKKGDAPIAFLDLQHLAANASSFTYVFFGFRNSDAIGDGNSREKKSHNQRWKGGRNTHKISL